MRAGRNKSFRAFQITLEPTLEMQLLANKNYQI